MLSSFIETGLQWGTQLSGSKFLLDVEHLYRLAKADSLHSSGERRTRVATEDLKATTRARVHQFSWSRQP